TTSRCRPATAVPTPTSRCTSSNGPSTRPTSAVWNASWTTTAAAPTGASSTSSRPTRSPPATPSGIAPRRCRAGSIPGSVPPTRTHATSSASDRSDALNRALRHISRTKTDRGSARVSCREGPRQALGRIPHGQSELPPRGRFVCVPPVPEQLADDLAELVGIGWPLDAAEGGCRPPGADPPGGATGRGGGGAAARRGPGHPRHGVGRRNLAGARRRDAERADGGAVVAVDLGHLDPAVRLARPVPGQLD